MKASEKVYLGDGVYVAAFEAHPGKSFVLTTSDGITDTNCVVLEPAVYESFIAWAESTKKGARPAPPPAPDAECAICRIDPRGCPRHDQGAA